MVRLTESFRFDDELASLLTAFQYRHDDITLTSSQSRPMPDDAVATPTPGLSETLGSDASLAFLVHDERSHQTVNPVEASLTAALTEALSVEPSTASTATGRTSEPGDQTRSDDATTRSSDCISGGGSVAGPGSAGASSDSVSVGVVTPHNAQRGWLETTLPDSVTTDTVEKYQGGERDVMIVSATVSDPEFARREDAFILDPRRLLVAVSRARIKTIVLCSDALFQVAPEDSDRLDDGLTWNRLFLLAEGRDSGPVWEGPADDFVHASGLANNGVDLSETTVKVYSSS